MMESLSIGYGHPHQDGAVLDLFTTWAHRTPQAPALIDGGRTLGYAELDRLADTVAESLRGKVGAGDLVGVCLGHSAELAAVTLAIAKLGAVHLPLGPRPGEKRLQAVAEQLRPACLIGDGPPGGAPPRGRGGKEPAPPPPRGAPTHPVPGRRAGVDHPSP
ncbi:AMP-binding protein, partial [Kitasatospora sp. NPDC059088]|uniref:AMP-binding protein n=1 Tax=Kitasatospora sp. NPDC059088 TaxID=3346722 RepID=UPI0036BCEDA4